MKGCGLISSYAVHKKYISIKIEIRAPVPAGVVEELQAYKGKTKTIRLGDLQIVAKINSINLGNTTGFLIQAKKYESVNNTLFAIINKHLDIFVSDNAEDKILLFLDRAAKVTGKNKADLLYEVTSFKSIKGKRIVFHLSDEQKNVVLDKLTRIIRKDRPPSTVET